MASEERDVKIIQWPENSARLEHEFKMEEPCPVAIHFLKPPAHVKIETSPKEPLHVDMKMGVSADDTIPVCLTLCEPICADSDYTVGLSILEKPLAAISIKGRTKLFNCDDEEPDELRCIDFTKLRPKQRIVEPYEYAGLTFTPLGDSLYTGLIGDPSGQTKLQFPPDGVRIEYPHPVSITDITVNNYADPVLTFTVYSYDVVLEQVDLEVNNEVKTLNIINDDITAVEIKGGQNESSIIEICYYPFY